MTNRNEWQMYESIRYVSEKNQLYWIFFGLNTACLLNNEDFSMARFKIPLFTVLYTE